MKLKLTQVLKFYAIYKHTTKTLQAEFPILTTTEIISILPLIEEINMQPQPQKDTVNAVNLRKRKRNMLTHKENNTNNTYKCASLLRRFWEMKLDKCWKLGKFNLRLAQ